jgi:hypothetical protein
MGQTIATNILEKTPVQRKIITKSKSSRRKELYPNVTKVEVGVQKDIPCYAKEFAGVADVPGDRSVFQEGLLCMYGLAPFA